MSRGRQRRRSDYRRKNTTLGEDSGTGATREQKTIIFPNPEKEIIRIGKVGGNEGKEEGTGLIITKEPPPHINRPIKIDDPLMALFSQFIASSRVGESRNGFGEVKEGVVRGADNVNGHEEMGSIMEREERLEADRVLQSGHVGRRMSSKGN